MPRVRLQDFIADHPKTALLLSFLGLALACAPKVNTVASILFLALGWLVSVILIWETPGLRKRTRPFLYSVSTIIFVVIGWWLASGIAWWSHPHLRVVSTAVDIGNVGEQIKATVKFTNDGDAPTTIISAHTVSMYEEDPTYTGDLMPPALAAVIENDLLKNKPDFKDQKNWDDPFVEKIELPFGAERQIEAKSSPLTQKQIDLFTQRRAVVFVAGYFAYKGHWKRCEQRYCYYTDRDGHPQQCSEADRTPSCS